MPTAISVTILTVHPLSHNTSSPERNCCTPNTEDVKHETGKNWFCISKNILVMLVFFYRLLHI